MLRQFARSGLSAVALLAAAQTSANTATPNPAPAAKLPAPARPPAATPPQADVGGDIPASLSGTWLVVQTIHTPPAPADKKLGRGEHLLNQIEFLRLTATGKQWRVEILHLPWPAPLKTAFTDAAKRDVQLTPPPAVLQAVTRDLPHATVQRPMFDRIAIYTTGHYPGPGTLPVHPDVKLTLLFMGTGGVHVVKSGTEYAATGITPDRISGRLSMGQVGVSSPGMVVPVGVKGDFTMYRLK